MTRKVSEHGARKWRRRTPPKEYEGGREVVYFVLNEHGAVKIGYTATLDTRLRQLASSHPMLFLIGTIPGGPDRELALHHRFARFREFHEWFRFDGECRAGILNLLEKEGFQPQCGI